MAQVSLHRIERDGRRFVIDPDTCFCFECDEISWDVLEHYPRLPTNRIVHLLGGQHPPAEVEEVIGELEWLRSTKSILPLKTSQAQLSAFEFQSGVNQVDLFFDGDSVSPEALCNGALGLLLGRSGEKKSLTLALHLSDLTTLGTWFSDWVQRAFGQANMTGKELHLSVVQVIPASTIPHEALAGHALSVALSFRSAEEARRVLRGWTGMRAGALGKLVRLCGDGDGVGLKAVVVPGHGGFSGAVDYLAGQGFTHIHIDLPAAYVQNPTLDPKAMVAGLEATAVAYAHQLLKKNYIRLEPVARVFHQIYEGKAQARSDDSGTHRFAIGAGGDIFPSRYFLGEPEMVIGNLRTGEFNEPRRGAFDDLGSLTTSPCGNCWARNLCGGGHSAIHWALSGAIRKPDPHWCDQQRAWFGAAIAAFNLLSAEGVDFARLYQQLRPGKRMSLWSMAKAALTMKVGIRPIEEADAPLLTRWENWSEATYFLGNEYGVFLATRYDREMDSLHPRGIEQEFMIVSRRGSPLGLLKVRPERFPGVARVWLFLQEKDRYLDSSLRSSIGHIVREGARQGGFTTLIASSGPGDGALGEFLHSIGFESVGTERDALFLHDAYHDLSLHQLTLRD